MFKFLKQMFFGSKSSSLDIPNFDTQKLLKELTVDNYSCSQKAIIANADTSKMKRWEIKRIEWSGEVSDITPTVGDIGINKRKKCFTFSKDGKWVPYSFNFKF